MNLRQILKDVSGASFISIDTETVPKLRGGKSNAMQGRVVKHMTGANVMVFAMKNGGSGYENMVKRRLEQEGVDPNSFNVGPRPWGVRIEGTPFVEHAGQLYLEVIFLHAGKVSYSLNNMPIARQDIDGLDGGNEESEQGGLINKVIIRTFKCDNITAITVNGKRYFADE